MRIDYKMITEQEFKNLMKIYDTSKQFAANQLDCFICETEDCYIPIDNRTGNMWTEEFCTLELCVDYFNGEDLKSLHKRNDNVFIWKDNGVVIV